MVDVVKHSLFPTIINSFEFNMDELPPFKFYRVKFVLTSTNQVYVPRVSNLRVITLA